MPQSDTDFASSLQHEWVVKEASYTRGQVKLLLERSLSMGFPNPKGRPGHLVMAEPKTYQMHQSAEVTFQNAIWFETVDEFSSSASSRREGKDAAFDGDKFRLYTKSALLNDQRKARTDQDASRLKHYELITSDVIINIVSNDAPTVLFRNFQILGGPYAG